jgi:DNA-binding PadR family transcriptional regulator
MDDASQEILEEYLNSWVDTHKKSALLFIILILIAQSNEPLWAKDLHKKITKATSWEITERGLYRSLQRMEKQGLLEHVRRNVPKTGADRKMYKMTELGTALLGAISSEMAYYGKLNQ